MSITIKGTPEATEIHRDYMEERREPLCKSGVIAVKRQPRTKGARGQKSTFVSTEGPDNGDDPNAGLEAGTSVTSCEDAKDIKIKKHLPDAISASETAREINPDQAITAVNKHMTAENKRRRHYAEAKNAWEKLKSTPSPI